MNINKWVPLEVTNEQGGKQIVYVKIDEFFKKTLIGEGASFERQMKGLILRADEERIGLGGSAGVIIEGREELLPEELQSIEEQGKHLANFLINTLSNEGTLEDTRETLHRYFDRPLSKNMQSAITIKFSPVIDPRHLENNNDLIMARAGTSNTVKGKTGESNLALENWKTADSLVRKWTQEGKDLSLQDIQSINRFLQSRSGYNWEI